MDILRAEAKAEGKVTKTTTKVQTKSSQQPTGIAALSSKIRKRSKEVKEEVKRPDVVKSSFCAPPPTLPELAPATTEAELNDLLDQIDAEIALDPELSQDLLELLEGDEGDEFMEDVSSTHEVPEVGASGFSGPLPDYIDEPSDFHSCDETQDDELTGDIEDDPEMAEMLKMLEHAKGDLEGAKEEELAHLMEHFDNEEMFQKKLQEHKMKKTSLKRKESDQVVPQSREEDAKKKKVVSPLDIMRAAKANKAAQQPQEQTIMRTPAFADGIAVQPNAEEKPVSFDEMANVDTISAPTKGRVAPPRNRRPPTRKRSSPNDTASSENPVSNDNSTINNNNNVDCDSADGAAMPMTSPGMMKKKKKFKKKGAPVGGVAMFGGADLFGGKNPFANRKVEPSSSEDETMEQAPQQPELRLPFGTVPSDSQDKPKGKAPVPAARKLSSSKRPEDQHTGTTSTQSKKQEEPKNPEEKSLFELKNGVKRLEVWIGQKLAFAQDDNIFKGDSNIDAQISDFNVVEAELSAQVYAVKGLQKRGNDMITQGHPDVPEIQATLDTLNKAWSELQTALFQKKQHLEEALAIIPFMQQCDDFLLWVKEKTVMLSSKEFHYEAQKAIMLKKKLSAIKSEMKKHEAQLSQIKKASDKLSKESHPQLKDVTAKHTKVLQSWEGLQAAVRTKDSQLSGASEVEIFTQTMDQIMIKIKNLESQLITDTGDSQEAVKTLLKHQAELDKSLQNLDSEVIKLKQSVDNYLFQHADHSDELRYVG